MGRESRQRSRLGFVQKRELRLYPPLSVLTASNQHCIIRRASPMSLRLVLIARPLGDEAHDFRRKLAEQRGRSHFGRVMR